MYQFLENGTLNVHSRLKSMHVRTYPSSFECSRVDHSLQFDTQGFSFLDWVLAKVSARRMLQIFTFLHTSFSKVIMTTRTWAVWNKNPFLTYVLPIFYVITWTGGFVLMGIFVQRLKCQYSFQ